LPRRRLRGTECGSWRAIPHVKWTTLSTEVRIPKADGFSGVEARKKLDRGCDGATLR
jgi:hypothetical protein